ncbi:hypothetical protein [Anaeromyxobacter terrae]|uniref:hypothetical protein n=1 Tax=Anaeromyxobacter terrae TaxID=2925406 RepID=UPI001F58F58C|nr:hypothetical protein [Anaeromyxobacter sp. SG22]
MANPAEPHESSSAPSQPRAARLAALRDDLDHRIDEIVDAGADRAPALKKEFDALWKTLKEEADKH